MLLRLFIGFVLLLWLVDWIVGGSASVGSLLASLALCAIVWWLARLLLAYGLWIVLRVTGWIRPRWPVLGSLVGFFLVLWLSEGFWLAAFLLGPAAWWLGRLALVSALRALVRLAEWLFRWVPERAWAAFDRVLDALYACLLRARRSPRAKEEAPVREPLGLESHPHPVELRFEDDPCWAVLRDPGSTASVRRAAYRRLCFRYHPDRLERDPGTQAAATRCFQTFDRCYRAS